MTLQELFDSNWDWFVVRGNPQSKTNDKCRYRGAGGTKCAIGCAMPDEVYDEDSDLHNWNIASLSQKTGTMALWAQQELGGILPKARALQYLHDDWYPGKGPFRAYMRNSLKAFAEDNRLTIPGNHASSTSCNQEDDGA